jgi:8-oxo-dGTP diphosphatase
MLGILPGVGGKPVPIPVPRTSAGYGILAQMVDPASPVPDVTPMLVVVAGVIRRFDGEILLAQRPHGVHMAGLWELPGGKVRDGESPPAALVRELREELGIEAEVGEPVTFAVHEEPGRRILLLFYDARILDGEPQSLEGQALVWVPPRRLADYETPPADAQLVRMLSLQG